jgi:serine/threonine protein kinase
MAIASVSALWEVVCKNQLLDPSQVAQIGKQPLTQFADPKALAKELLKRGWLTAFQANSLLLGRGGELVLGNYLLLERLGEGGMGQVFKARHRSMDRIVALKLIHKDRLNNPTAIRRFYNEVKAAARLSHPNIVLAFDADQIGGTHYLVMEYVDGLDLSKLVKQQGTLPVDRACDYIRQAALGLQHAHELGLVHRDIKPHNLLVTRKGGLVKILDMGLARLIQEEGGVSNESGLTKDGFVVGSIDYLAPEQALDAHSADIRADLYSLGCTFYYLLAGRVPFPGEVAMQKLLKHRLEEPTPLAQLRPEVPPGVAAIVRKLMAKEPAQRYQTPAEAAAALQPASRGTTNPEDTLVSRGQAGDLNSVFADLGSNDTVEAAGLTRSTRRQPPAKPPKRLLLMLGGGLAGALLAGALLALLLSGDDKKNPHPAPTQAVAARTTPQDPDEVWNNWVRNESPEEQFKIVMKRLQELNPGFDGKATPVYSLGLSGLTMQADFLRDISPLKPLSRLDTLIAPGSAPNRGLLLDLKPLQGMHLSRLEVQNNAVFDLTPVKGMPLVYVNLSATRVADLSPISNSQLADLRINNTPVTKLPPLGSTRLTRLEANDTRIDDWAGLQGTALTFLTLNNTPTANLEAFQDLKSLGQLHLTNTGTTDLKPLKQLVKLTMLSCANNANLADLDGVQDLTALTNFNFGQTKVASLEPLKGLTRLGTLSCNNTLVADLGPLQGLMALVNLNCAGTPVSDLAPLAGLKITQLRITGTRVTDLSPVKQLPLQKIWLDFQPERDSEILRAIQTLQTINDRPKAEVLK